jgi:hypothetical protein
MTDTKHAEAYEMQCSLARIDEQMKELKKAQKSMQDAYDRTINEIKASGQTSAGGFRLKETIKRKTNRVIMLDKIKAENPGILFSTGTYAMKAAEMEWTEEKRQAYIDKYDYKSNYVLMLGELDDACGGKKYNDFTVDEVAESVTYAIEPEEIIEV